MPLHGLLTRLLQLFVGIVGVVLGVIGGLALGAPALLAVLLSAAFAGLIAAGVLRESPTHDRPAVVEGAVVAAGLVAAAIVLLVGVATTAGGAVASLAVVGAATVWGLRRLARVRRRGPVRRGPLDSRPARSGAAVQQLAVTQPGDALFSAWTEPAAGFPDLTRQSTSALGREWLRTTAALAGRLDPGGRRAVVERRQATLDELERRDPAGFARWLATGPVPGSDPVAFVRDGPAAGTEAA